MVELDIMDDAEEEDEDAAIVEFDEVDDDEVELPPETSMPVPHGMSAPVPGWVALVGSVVDPSAAAI